MSKEEKYRLHHYTIFLALGLPVLVVFGIYNLLIGKYLLCTLVFLCTVALVCGWYLLGRLAHGQTIHRVISTIFAVLLLYLLATGAQDGSTILWLYTYPLFIIFLLGAREGALWSAASLVVAGVFLYWPPDFASVFPYNDAFTVRFMVTYLIVSAVSLWFQHLRHQYFVDTERRQAELEEGHRRLEREIEHRRAAERSREEVILDLQAALEKVKTLSGLIPICASCHKIRDDEGFWDQMESYIARHSDAQFSHGICPDCMSRLYPQYRRTVGGE